MEQLVMTPVVWPNRLRELRQLKSQKEGRQILIEDVAAACDCSIGYLSRVEKGRSRPSEELLNALADYYKVKPSKLGTGEVVKPKIGETNIIGAFIRRFRQEKGGSISTFAKQLRDATKLSISDSSVRNIEAGHRAFLGDDEVTMALLDMMELGSLDELRAKAVEEYGAGHLNDILTSLHGEVAADVKLGGPRAYADGSSAELRSPLPKSVSDIVASDDSAYAVRLDKPSLGSAFPLGMHFVARQGAEPKGGGYAIAWIEGRPTVVRVFLDQNKGLKGLRDRPRESYDLDEKGLRVDRVTAMVLPE